MTTIAIMSEEETDNSAFRAVAAGEDAQAFGSTPGAALDALIAQLGVTPQGTLTVVQSMQPDRYFSKTQIHRLQMLMQRSQEAAEGIGSPLTSQEESERNALIKAELLASAQRAAALADALGK